MSRGLAARGWNMVREIGGRRVKLSAEISRKGDIISTIPSESASLPNVVKNRGPTHHVTRVAGESLGACPKEGTLRETRRQREARKARSRSTPINAMSKMTPLVLAHVPPLLPRRSANSAMVPVEHSPAKRLDTDSGRRVAGQEE